MTKRRCPFEEDYLPQSKVHLTKKQFEQTNPKAMENIWNKTRDLLFEGAKKYKDEKKVITEGSEKCDFCQKTFELLSDCTECQGWFCTNCSFTTYGDNLTASICLSCA